MTTFHASTSSADTVICDGPHCYETATVVVVDYNGEHDAWCGDCDTFSFQFVLGSIGAEYHIDYSGYCCEAEFYCEPCNCLTTAEEASQYRTESFGQ